MPNDKIYLAVFMFIAGVLITTAVVSGPDSRYAFSVDTEAINSPSDHLSAKDLQVFSDRVIIYKENLVWATIKDTHSMEPVLNKNSISLELPPQDSSEINEGDIISFKQGSIVIIHRVVLIGEDELGWFAATKGDNNDEPDPYKVRFSDVKGIVVGVLY